jgi:transcriptional regulator with XRE-family HTH domain
MARAAIDKRSKEEVGKRLALTRKALGYTTTRMCELMGSASHGSAYTNYEMGRRKISLEHAIELCDQCSLTLEWIYLGEIGNLPEYLQKAIQQLQGRQPRIVNN